MAKTMAALPQVATVYLDADHHPVLGRPAEPRWHVRAGSAAKDSTGQGTFE